MTGTFKITWLQGYGDVDGKSDTWDGTMFDEDAGFTAHDQAAIGRLDPGEEVTLGGPLDAVRVERLS